MKCSPLQRKLEKLTFDKKRLHKYVICIQKSFFEVDCVLKNNCFKKGKSKKEK